MAYTVAQAEVTVVPDARGFGEKLRAQVATEADRIGREAGEKIADGIRDRVRVALAKLPDANVDLDVDTAGATAQVDTFLAETRAKSAAAGDGAGQQLGSRMAESTGQGFKARSALIGTAVGLGLAAGAPLAVAGAGVLFGGLAAVILHNQEDVGNAASALGQSVTAAYSHIADSVVPKLTSALGQIQSAAVRMAPAVGEVFDNLGPAIQGVTDGVIGLVRNALPGLAAAIQKGTPVFQGLADFMEKIGTGISNLFSIIAAHSGAVGATFSALGDIISTLLSVLGELVSAGAELGQTILPVLASALGLVGDALHVLQPILPEILTAFLAYKAIGLLGGPIAAFGETLGKLAKQDLPGISSAAGAAQGAVGAFGKSLPLVGVALAVYGSAFVHNQDQIHSWANALLEGGAAARVARSEMDSSPSAWDRFSFAVAHGGSTLGMTTKQAREAREEFRALLEQLSPIERAQTLATKAQNDLSDALARLDADGAATALARYNTHTADAARLQAELDAKINGTSEALEQNKQRLQGLANVTGAANTAINLLKEGLDALSGKAISLGDAEVAVTQAVASASGALEGMTGRLTDGSGALDLHTQKGAAAWSALTALAGASNTLIATMEQQGKTTAEVTAKDDQLRAQFINTARQMGLSAGAAQNLANQIYGIPSERHTEITADTAEATRKAQALKDLIDSIRSKTVQVGVNYHVAGLNGQPGGTTLANASGNIVHAYAGGGFESMPGGVAQIVAPQTFRLIGDRVTDDEAYIPINDSARSLEILSQTANRMGYGLDRGTGGGGMDADRFGAAVARHLGSVQPMIGQVVTQKDETGFEIAERLSFLARTRV